MDNHSLHQNPSWKYRWDFPGRYALKNYFPRIYKWIQSFNERPVDTIFKSYLNDIQPDVVQSFALHLSCSPIFNVMNDYPHIKWILSTWGSDLYYHQNLPRYKEEIINVFPRIDYLFTDCYRDVNLAKQMGFKGEVLGVFPGGGGYHIKEYESQITKSLEKRDFIMVKGYQGNLGRCITVLKALMGLRNDLEQFKIIIFGADAEVVEFVKISHFDTLFNVEIFTNTQPIPHKKILELMGKALVYIGNSISDGMPNTLLEAIIMGAFPIQSNPGGATAEIIRNGKNGILIEDCENIEAIKLLILKALANVQLMKTAFYINQKEIKPQLERSLVTSRVLKAYDSIDCN